MSRMPQKGVFNVTVVAKEELGGGRLANASFGMTLTIQYYL